MDAEKLTKWSKEIHETAVAHGWHEEKHSPEHYLGLVMTEVAEAVEADRENRYCGYVNLELLDNISDFGSWYRGVVKGTADEEFADIVIRLLDMAYEIYGQVAFEVFTNASVYEYKPDKEFVESAYGFVRCNIGVSVFDIVGSIEYMFAWAEHLGIDLDQHIEWKMRYNSLREYKHGGKKY